MDELISISPIDGRYASKTSKLAEYFSEYALIKSRVFVELKYLVALKKADESILKVHSSFDLREAKEVKEIEKTLAHDVKAVEYYLRKRFPDLAPFIHYGLTSEDINNIAYSLCITSFLKESYLPKVSRLLEQLKEKSLLYKRWPMLSRTHGQPASPTTLGKEFMVFFTRLKGEYLGLKGIKLPAKLNGATGNFNALFFAEPETDWIGFSRKFISSLGLEPSMITTQVEPKDKLVSLFQNVKRTNNIILDMTRDMWLYIMLGYFRMKIDEKEVGSSTMPHKLNPIDFENAEGNLKVANAMFSSFEELQVSRLQRDLSDSTIMRNIGAAFSYSIIAYDSVLNGISKILPDKERMSQDLNSHPEILGEAVQTFLRKKGKADAYELMKKFSRGKVMALEDLYNFINSLNLSKPELEKLRELKPYSYIGLVERFFEEIDWEY